MLLIFAPLLPPQGVSLPKAQNKFENFLKHGYKVSDAKVQYTFRVPEYWSGEGRASHCTPSTQRPKNLFVVISEKGQHGPVSQVIVQYFFP